MMHNRHRLDFPVKLEDSTDFFQIRDGIPIQFYLRDPEPLTGNNVGNALPIHAIIDGQHTFCHWQTREHCGFDGGRS